MFRTLQVHRVDDNTFNLYDSLSLCVSFLMLSNRLFDRSVQRGKGSFVIFSFLREFI
jgi:hypothetical protein